MDFITLFITLAVSLATLVLVGRVIHDTDFVSDARDMLYALRLWVRYVLVLLWNAWRRRQLRRLTRDINAKCPSCGHKRGLLTGSKELRLLIHRCLICGVQWGEPFLVDPTLWIQEAPPGG